ncbi:hypothetical protein [Microbacterium sp. K41]|uniref:hypothetical protein n=1 Tax=Microbacterium sp. K41 TaxID=2305437 RepID=UPI00109D5264|nr:hypothetical protein [Microbacterium sp. K41]
MTESIDPAAASEDTTQATTTRGSKRPFALWLAIGIAAVVIVSVAIVVPITIANAEAAEKAAAEQAAADAEYERLATFAKAFNACDVRSSEYVEILDRGEAVSFNAVGKLYGPSIDDLYCVLGEVDAPSTLEAKIGATRALDGVQTDEWSGYEIEWRYHPDDGATVLIEHAK